MAEMSRCESQAQHLDAAAEGTTAEEKAKADDETKKETVGAAKDDPAVQKPDAGGDRAGRPARAATKKWLWDDAIYPVKNECKTSVKVEFSWSLEIGDYGWKNVAFSGKWWSGQPLKKTLSDKDPLYKFNAGNLPAWDTLGLKVFGIDSHGGGDAELWFGEVAREEEIHIACGCVNGGLPCSNDGTCSAPSDQGCGMSVWQWKDEKWVHVGGQAYEMAAITNELKDSVTLSVYETGKIADATTLSWKNFGRQSMLCCNEK